MNIKLLTTSTVLKENLLNNLADLNITIDIIESNQSLYPQLKDAEILINSSSTRAGHVNFGRCTKTETDTPDWNRC